MTLVDMHLNPVASPDLGSLEQVSAESLARAYDHFEPLLEARDVAAAVMVVLDPGLLTSDDDAAVAAVAARRERLRLACAVDFRGDGPAQLRRAGALGVAFLKFHPYIQGIVDGDFSACAALARQAEAQGMAVMVCGSYGTRALDRHSGVRLAAHLAGEVACPIVLSHFGGARVLDAMLVAADAPQLYLETSFSLPYYVGSTVETDLAFAIRKLGAERWLYGSDAPFVGLDEAEKITRDFLGRHQFSEDQARAILHDNGARLLEAL